MPGQKTRDGFILRFLLKPRVLMLLIFLWAVVARFAVSKNIYQLDYSLFQPDGRFYYLLSMRFSGHSWLESWSHVQIFFTQEHVRHLNANSWLVRPWLDNSLKGEIFTRPLYSLLSIPFVLLFGGYGMLIVPIFCLLGIGFLLISLGHDYGSPWLGVVFFAILTFSTSFMRWTVVNYTDPLLYLLVCAMVWAIQKPSRRWWQPLLVGLGLMTRPSAPIWVVLLIAGIFFGGTWKGLAFLTSTFILLANTIFLIFFTPSAIAITSPHGMGFGYRVMHFLSWLGKVLFSDFGELFVIDKVMFVLLLLPFIGLAIKEVRMLTLLYGTLLIVVFLMGAWNGGLGVNLRYEMPAIFLAVPQLFLLTHITFKNIRIQHARSPFVGI